MYAETGILISTEIDTMPEVGTKIMMNVGNPDRAFDFACLPHEGVGLARLEFIINRMIGVHPVHCWNLMSRLRNCRLKSAA
ncbi:hypothetical protein ACNKHW_09425 [Shigella flexneri]